MLRQAFTVFTKVESQGVFRDHRLKSSDTLDFPCHFLVMDVVICQIHTKDSDVHCIMFGSASRFICATCSKQHICVVLQTVLGDASFGTLRFFFF